MEARLFAPRQTWHAPHLLDIELAQVIRRYVARGEIAAARGRAALADLALFSLHRYPHDVLLPRVWELRHNLTVYDARLCRAGRALDAPLLTRDQRLAGAPGHLVWVELV